VRSRASAGSRNIITTDQGSKNFELSLEWNIAKNGTADLSYRASEHPGDDASLAAPGDAGARATPDTRGPVAPHGAGADYGCNPSPAGVVKPAGQWNQVRLVVKGNHVEHWLNGVKVVEYELLSPDWEAKVKASSSPTTALRRNAEGYIGLQSTSTGVAFRISRSGAAVTRLKLSAMMFLQLFRLGVVVRHHGDLPGEHAALHRPPDRDGHMATARGGRLPILMGVFADRFTRTEKLPGHSASRGRPRSCGTCPA